MSNEIEKLIAGFPARAVSMEVDVCGHTRELSLVRRVLHGCLASFSVSGSILSDLKLALTEACTNVIRHAFKHDPQRKFNVHLQASEKVMVLKVRYLDQHFKPENIPLPDFTKVQEGGFGVFIIRQVMDDVIYSIDSMTGYVTLQMVKKLESSLADDGAIQ